MARHPIITVVLWVALVLSVLFIVGEVAILTHPVGHSEDLPLPSAPDYHASIYPPAQGWKVILHQDYVSSDEVLSGKTDIVAVPKTWRIAWSCNLASLFGEDFPVRVDVVYVTSPHDSFMRNVDTPVNAMCEAGNTHGVVVEQSQGLRFAYLEIGSIGSWDVQVEVPTPDRVDVN